MLEFPPVIEREPVAAVRLDPLGISGSFAFGWLGILLVRLNLPEFVASQPFIFSGFKALRRPFGTTVPTPRGQGQCPVLNLEDGSDNFADAISL